MDPVNEIIKKIRDLTTSKKKKLIDQLFKVTLIEEPSNGEIQVKQEEVSEKVMEIQVVKEEPNVMQIKPEEIPAPQKPSSQNKRNYSKYSEDFKKEAVRKAIETNNNRYELLNFCECLNTI